MSDQLAIDGAPAPEPVGDEFAEWLEHYRETTGRKMTGTKIARAQFRARRQEGFTLEDLKAATVGNFSDRWLRDNGFAVPETILAARKVTRYIALAARRNGSRPSLVRPRNA